MKAIEANIAVQDYLSIVWGSLIAAAILYNVIFIVAGYIRTIACMNNDKQQYFASPHPLWDTSLMRPSFGNATIGSSSCLRLSTLVLSQADCKQSFSAAMSA